jgi:hypothetical protein
LAPVPLSGTPVVLPLLLLLLIVSSPFTAPDTVGSNCTCRVADAPGFRVTGRTPGTTLKSAPVTVAELTVTADVPEDVSVTDCCVGKFRVTLPKANDTALKDNCGLCTAVPLPLNRTASVPLLEELLLIVSCPRARPVFVGSNWTWRIRDWPGFKVAGKLLLSALKPIPLIVAELTVTGELPVEVRVNGCGVDEPTVTSPKPSLSALKVSCGLVAPMPVPVKGTSAFPPSLELLPITRSPETPPAVVGLN